MNDMISGVNLLRGEILELLEEAEIPLLFVEIKEELKERDLICERRSLKTALNGLIDLGLITREKKNLRIWLYSITKKEIPTGKKGPPRGGP